MGITANVAISFFRMVELEMALISEILIYIDLCYSKNFLL